ncbi:2OG-Fe(II) oxygenase [Aliiroseovarius sp. S1339]|uniref:HalD/BesD family halogenase n=1 Tax=Aliiroseovarius sp. S1339 TaxID=2936990 RepID=UPI0020BF1D34|nr:2OG-Fe(II) oxygenase [Aliiroseovarius sp. S1339]MCK8464456.1 2OG-Fe(II) oxygenase [Aliiroseovarius sp. S1339]
MLFEDIVNLNLHPVTQPDYSAECRAKLDSEGVLVLEDFISPAALTLMHAEGTAAQDKAYFCAQSHSVYLTPDNPAYPDDHPANRKVLSSKGCICDDVIGAMSPLRVLYDEPTFRDFVAETTGQTELHPYADPLSSINVHYANRDQELGWHFDNSSFAITLLIQKPDAGSRFEYVKGLRDADAGEMNYDGVDELFRGAIQPQVLSMEPGTLVLFRGRNSIHRVTPNESDRTRMLAVLAYNAEPGVTLSESARMTFYGRLD